MDNLIEQVVPKKRDAGYVIRIIIIILIALGIPAGFVVAAELTQAAYLVIIGLFLLFFCAYGAWYFITSQNVEYEYSFFSSVLRIDRIISKRKRKPVVKVDVKRFDDFFPYTDGAMDKRKFNKIYHAAHEEFSEKNYVASFRDEATGKCAIIFTPNDDLLNEMKLYFGNELRKNLFKNKQL